MASVVARASPIGGTGVFSLVGLRRGDVACPFKLEREVTADAPLRPELGERPEHCPAIEGRRFLVAEPERYLNHSCDPNTYLRYRANGIDVVALRDIAPDDELTLDYLINNEGGDSWPCNCGAGRCRGETAHSFFTLPEAIQREYFPLLAPWFVERNADRLEHLTRSP